MENEAGFVGIGCDPDMIQDRSAFEFEQQARCRNFGFEGFYSLP
jgi:hypothetical protein